jgi:hypothetical protein
MPLLTLPFLRSILMSFLHLWLYVSKFLLFSEVRANNLNRFLLSIIGPLNYFRPFYVPSFSGPSIIFIKATSYSIKEVWLSNLCMLCNYLADYRLYIFRLNCNNVLIEWMTLSEAYSGYLDLIPQPENRLLCLKFLWFSSVPTVKCQDNRSSRSITVLYDIFQDSLFTDHRENWRCVVHTTESFMKSRMQVIKLIII